MIRFSYNLTHQPDSVAESGIISEEEALVAFRAIPWPEELAMARRLELLSPSIYLEESESGRRLAASVVGAPPDSPLEFLVMFVSPVEIDGEPDEAQIDSDGHDLDSAAKAISAFYRSDWERLQAILTAG